MARSLRLSLLALLLTATAASADLVYRDDTGDSIRLFEKESPCPAEIATRAQQGDRGYYRLAEVVIDGVKVRACAAPAASRQLPGVPFVHIIVEGRGSDFFPLAQFEQEKTKGQAI